MADLISLTGTIVRVNGTGAQSLEDAVDIGAYDELVLLTMVTGLEGASTITVAIETGMQTDTTDGWLSLGSFAFTASGPNTSGGSPALLALAPGQFLRYIRWNVTALTGVVTFWVSGRATAYPRS